MRVKPSSARSQSTHQPIPTPALRSAKPPSRVMGLVAPLDATRASRSRSPGSRCSVRRRRCLTLRTLLTTVSGPLVSAPPEGPRSACRTRYALVAHALLYRRRAVARPHIRLGVEDLRGDGREADRLAHLTRHALKAILLALQALTPVAALALRLHAHVVERVDAEQDDAIIGITTSSSMRLMPRSPRTKRRMAPRRGRKGAGGGRPYSWVGADPGVGAFPESSERAALATPIWRFGRMFDPRWAGLHGLRQPRGAARCSPICVNHAGKRRSGKNSLTVLHCGRKWGTVGPTLNRTGMARFLPPRHPRSRIR